MPKEGIRSTASTAWDCNGGVTTSRTDENGLVTQYKYLTQGGAGDPHWRLTETDYPDGGKTTTTYNDTGSPANVITSHLIDSNHTLSDQTNFDGFSRPVQNQLTSDPIGVDYIDTTYDGLGRTSTKSNRHRSSAFSTDGVTTTYYDGMDRVCLVVPPDGTQPTGGICPTTRPTGDVLSTYSGNCTTVTDQAGNSRRTCTDALDRLTQVFEDPAGLNYETDYTYDAVGNLLSVNQKGNDPNSANWRTRSFTYDHLSRLLTASNPESGTITYTYDSDTNCSTPNSFPDFLVSKTDARGIRTCMRYDALGRITAKNYSNGDPSSSYAYDAFVSGTNCGIGFRTGMTDASGSSSWTYDKMGRIWTEAHTNAGFTKTISNLYNLDGSIQQITYPSGSVIAYGYDSAGHLLSINDTAHNISYLQANSISPPAFAPPGQLALATYGGTIKRTNIYNSRLQPCWYYATTSTQLDPSTACTTSATVGGVFDQKYNFGLGTNDNGNLQSITNNKDSNRSINYTYDPLNRLASASTANADCSLVPNTNLTKNWGESFTLDAWANLKNRTVTKCSAEPLSVVALSNNQLSAFGYDSAGNMTSNGSLSYTYDAESRLKTAVGVTYTYDGHGNRVAKSNGTLYWGDGPLLESDSGGNLLHEYIFGAGARIARRDLADGTVHYFFGDHLGSTHVQTNASGAIENDSDFYPYGGERIYAQATANQNYRFTGKERDGESGLDYFGARYNASSMGRFMTPDSIAYSGLDDPQSLNLYSYVGNHPTSMIDPDGRCWSGFNWLCNTYQRFANWSDGDGFRTNKQVDSTPSRNDPRAQRRRQQEVSRNPVQRYFDFFTPMAERELAIHGRWNRWWAAHDCENNPYGGCGVGPSLASLGLYTRPMARVGRWMSPDELEKMRNSGRVQESYNKGVTSVTVPPNPNAYKNVPEGDVFVEFDVPASSVTAIEGGWGKIYGPSSVPYGEYYGITEMPEALNILELE